MKKINPETGEDVSEAKDRYLLKCHVYHTSHIMDNESMTVKKSCKKYGKESYQFKDELQNVILKSKTVK